MEAGAPAALPPLTEDGDTERALEDACLWLGLTDAYEGASLKESKELRRLRRDKVSKRVRDECQRRHTTPAAQKVLRLAAVRAGTWSREGVHTTAAPSSPADALSTSLASLSLLRTAADPAPESEKMWRCTIDAVDDAQMARLHERAFMNDELVRRVALRWVDTKRAEVTVVLTIRKTAEQLGQLILPSDWLTMTFDEAAWRKLAQECADPARGRVRDGSLVEAARVAKAAAEKAAWEAELAAREQRKAVIVCDGRTLYDSVIPSNASTPRHDLTGDRAASSTQMGCAA